MHWRFFQLVLIMTQLQDCINLLGRKTGCKIVNKFLLKQRKTLSPATRVTKRILNRDLCGRRAVLEEDLNGVRYGAFARIEVIATVTHVFHHCCFGTQSVNTGVRSGAVFIVISTQVSFEKSNGYYVLQTVVAVSRVMQWTSFTDNPQGRFVRSDGDSLDLLQPGYYLGMECNSAFKSRLCVKFGGKDLKEDIFYDVRVERARKTEGVLPPAASGSGKQLLPGCLPDYLTDGPIRQPARYHCSPASE